MIRLIFGQKVIPPVIMLYNVRYRRERHLLLMIPVCSGLITYVIIPVSLLTNLSTLGASSSQAIYTVYADEAPFGTLDGSDPAETHTHQHDLPYTCLRLGLIYFRTGFICHYLCTGNNLWAGGTSNRVSQFYSSTAY